MTESRWSRRRFLGASANVVQLAGAVSIGGMLLPCAAARAAEIRTTDLGGVFLLEGAGANVLALPGPEGALMVDGGLAEHAEALLRAVYDATGNDRVHTLINTHWHSEQIGANELVGRAGGVIFAHEKARLFLSHLRYSATYERIEPLPEAARPNQVTRGDGSFEFAGQRVDYGYLPQAHTDGDLYVHFPELDVVAVGGVLSAERWPLIDYRNGAWYGGRVRALQWLAELVAPDTKVVPADGRVMTGREVVRHRDLHLALFETMIGYMNMGLGYEDVVAINPLKEHEAEFGDASAFLDGAYRSMTIAFVPE